MKNNHQFKTFVLFTCIFSLFSYIYLNYWIDSKDVAVKAERHLLMETPKTNLGGGLDEIKNPTRGFLPIPFENLLFRFF